MSSNVRPVATLLVSAVLLLAPALASAQSGSTLTPDRLTYLVNKDVGALRWTINFNLASLDPPRPINVTGNVYDSAGGAPSFVWCQEHEDSTGTLSDPNSIFRLRCSGASACGDTATGCARNEWQTIAELIEIPASFFLPDGGNGLASARRDAERPALDLARVASTQAAGPAGVSARGANLPPDGSNFLVNKELGGLRWSISLNLIPAQRGNGAVSTCGDRPDCIISNRVLNVTGNVYPLDGSPPQFVFCQERQDSTGTLQDPASEFRFGCVGAAPCDSTASECAERDWQPIPGGGDIRLQASFFLPPGGLPATPQSDPDIVVIGRTSDPPAVVAPLGSGAVALGEATVQGGCAEGAACSVGIGSCASVQGSIVLDEAVGCACRVDDVPPECIVCGGGATGTCGGDCQYQVGGATARGQCLPFSSTSGGCACYAAEQGDQVAISICGGALGNECPSGKCCTDDIRDGCDPAAGDEDCPGLCVDSGGCDPTTSVCGSCFDQREQTPLVCGTLEAPPGASCCEDCPDGSTSCYCDPGRVCNLEAEGGGCCPTSRPDFCNASICIPSGANCCVDCPDGGNSCYCAAGSLCVLEAEGGGCCPLDKPVACNGLCLEPGLECCADCPEGEDACWCAQGSLCVPEDEGGGCVSCPAETPVNCRNECLPAGSECCYDQFGGFCEPGFECVLGSDACRPLDGAAALGEAQSRPRVQGDGGAASSAPVRSPKLSDS
ncbi:MAG: hypothetical protein AB1689_23225 [Thermodesulfobacteriota bacterium]